MEPHQGETQHLTSNSEDNVYIFRVDKTMEPTIPENSNKVFVIIRNFAIYLYK